MKTVEVGLGERAYPILIQDGLIDKVGEDLEKRRVAKRYFMISDDHVDSLYGNRLLDSLSRKGLPVERLTFPRGEASKNFGTVADLSSRLARMGCDRKDGLIALGGGVTGDITGFLAAVYMRGIPFVQIPTTLLAQVDSSVGGKTGIDIPEGKNLVGAFYQPKCVFIDTGVLKTLPRPELLNGLAEVIKYSVIYDSNFFDYLAARREQILELDLQIVEEVIQRCCTIKAEVVAADEKESDLRRILNFGHTIGHAVEGASDYTIDHGLAVAIGMAAVSRLAVAKGLLPAAVSEKVIGLIEAYGMPSGIPMNLDRGRIKEYLKTDKKAVSGRPFFVLPTEIGKVVITDEVPESLIDQVLA